MSATRRVLKPGLYGPLPTFFADNQDLDLVSFKKHLLNLATKGIVPVCAGSLGEAVHLSHDERIQLIRFTRQTLDDANLTSLPIVAGVGGSSTRETIKLAHEAHKAGADAGLVIPPSYYARSLETDDNQVVQYYVDICAGSPIPIFLYNFPSNAAGLDMSSSVIERIIARAPNLCGVKLTCGGNIAKLIRLSSLSNIHAGRPLPFLFLDGLIADLTPWVSSGGHGTVSGIPNFAPLASIKLWNLLTLPTPSEEELQKARHIQAILSKADVAAVPAGVRGMSMHFVGQGNVMSVEADAEAEYVLHKLHEYSPAPRRPLLPLQEEEGDKFLSALGDLLELEKQIRDSGEVSEVNTELP